LTSQRFINFNLFLHNIYSSNNYTDY
jgi:hypothetical protein